MTIGLTEAHEADKQLRACLDVVHTTRLRDLRPLDVCGESERSRDHLLIYSKGHDASGIFAYSRDLIPWRDLGYHYEDRLEACGQEGMLLIWGVMRSGSGNPQDHHWMAHWIPVRLVNVRGLDQWGEEVPDESPSESADSYQGQDLAAFLEACKGLVSPQDIVQLAERVLTQASQTHQHNLERVDSALSVVQASHGQKMEAVAAT